MEYTKEDLRKVFNNVINEIETTNGRVLSMYDVRELTSQGIPVIGICIENIPIACLKDGFEKWLKSFEMKQKAEVVCQLEHENGASISKDNIKVKIDYKKEDGLTLMKPSFSICLNPLESWFYFETKQGLVKGQILSTKLDSMTNEELICTMSTGHEVYVSELIPCLDEQSQP